MGRGDKADVAVRKGEVLGGRYRVERVLGEGGMGVVVAARHVDLDQRVALKFMLPRREGRRDARERFLREARVAVKLRSPHVARVMDVGTFKRGGKGMESPYIVMEYLEGSDLEEVLEKSSPIEIEDAVEYLLHACEAVGEAHAHDIVHRDLKPANLFLTKHADGSPCVKVLDFGISKLTSAAQVDGSLTNTNSAMGTPYYMSPEQMRSAKSVDARSDIWSLGVIAYELFSGNVPFEGDSATELTANVLEREVPPLDRSDLPDELEEIVLKCLHKEPDERYQTVADLASDLAAFAPSRAESYGDRVSQVVAEAVSSQRSREADSEQGGPAKSITGAAWGATQHKHRSPNHLIAVAAAMVVVAVLVGFFVGQMGPSDEPTQAGQKASEMPAGRLTANQVAEDVPHSPTADVSAAVASSAAGMTSGVSASSTVRPQASIAAAPPRTADAHGGRTAAVPAKPAPAEDGPESVTSSAVAGQPSLPEHCKSGKYEIDEQGTRIPIPECFR